MDAAQLAQAAAVVPTVRADRRALRSPTTSGTAWDMIRCFKAVTHGDLGGDRGRLWLTRPRRTRRSALAADLIRIDTTNRGGGDARERPAAEYVAAALAEAGLDPAAAGVGTPGRANVVARIERRRSGPRPRCCCTATSTWCLPSPADWSVHPFSGEIRDGVLWGRGAVDMKNAVAVLVAVARDLARTGRRPARDVVLAFTADEEDTAADGAAWLVGQASRAVRRLHRGDRRVRRVHLPRGAGPAAVPGRHRPSAAPPG